jgi:CheY-like chemotaxis protein
VSTILLLEDDPAILSLMSMILEPAGHVLLPASVVEEAYKRFDEVDGGVDLLIADVTLPVTSGIRVALKLRSALPNLAVILTSGYTPDLWDREDLAELNRLAFASVAILEKPFFPADLLQMVSRFVGCHGIPRSGTGKG